MKYSDGLDRDYTLPNWQERCEFWVEQAAPTRRRLRRQREQNSLILAGHGLSLRIDRGCLVARDGNTHYPATQREWRFFKGGLDTPPAIIIVDGSGNISLDAIDWMANQNVPLIRLRWDGQFSSVITNGGQAASLEKIRWQEKTRNDPKARLAFALTLVRQKADSTLVTMSEHVPRSSLWDKVNDNMQRKRDSLHGAKQPKSLSSLLGIEGAIAAEYFRAWSAIELKWGKAKRSAIPDDWRTYISRSALRSGVPRNRKATHPVNAMLNYAYGILSARTHIDVIAQGYDPRVGIVHHDVDKAEGVYYGFVLDKIEPMRPVIDRVILKLIESTIFCCADFSIQHDGACRLNPELARLVMQSTIPQ